MTRTRCIEATAGRSETLAVAAVDAAEANGLSSASGFRPVLVARTLFLSAEHSARPPRGVLPGSALDVVLADGADDNVFLTTQHGRLHETTLMVLEYLVAERAVLSGARVALDYGCGSGVLALSALRLGHPELIVHATDISEAALECTRYNGELNGATARLRAAAPWEVPRSMGASVAMANMLPGPLIGEAVEIAARLQHGALLLITGFRSPDLAAVRAAFEAHFDLPEQPTTSRAGWLMLACRRRKDDVNLVALSSSAVE